MLKGKSRLSYVAVAMLFLPSIVYADSTIYSNLNSDPANLYASGTLDVSNTVISGIFQSVAASFTSSGNFQLTQLDLAIQFLGGGNNTPDFNISLVTDVAGRPSTTTLFAPDKSSYLAPTTLNGGGDCCSLLTISAGPGVNLLAGQTYWLVGFPGDAASTDFWQFNNTGASTSWALSADGSGLMPDPSTWVIQSGATPAFALLGTPLATPEPSTLMSLLAGLALLAAFSARRS
jgi:hypothetical protein